MRLKGDPLKKFIYRFVAASVIILLIINNSAFCSEPGKVILNIAGKDYSLLTASTSSERYKGLSGISKLKNADGMIFYFNPPRMAAFWNKDTHLDLELIWFSKGKVVGRNSLPSIDKAGLINIQSPGEVDAVVELVR